MIWLWLIGLLLAIAGGISVNNEEKWENSIKKGTRWLLQRRQANFDWPDGGTARALMALKGVGPATGCWDPQSLEAQLSTNQLELELMQKLWQTPKEIEQSKIMLYAMALTVMCRDPRNFYSTNLLDLLTLENTLHDFTFAFGTLAICAGRGDVKPSHVEKLVDLSNHTDGVFLNDALAMISMALACVAKDPNNSYNVELVIRSNLVALASIQNPDGSFGTGYNSTPGNLATTVIIMQALSLQKDLSKVWRREAAFDWLVSKQNADGSFGNAPHATSFTLTAEALLALSGTGYGHISLSSCNVSRPTRVSATIPTNPNVLANITYTLWHYPNISQIHNLNLTVPLNETFYEVMKMAEKRDPAYKFEAKKYDSGVLVQTIGQLRNEVQTSTYWWLYRTPNFPDPKIPPPKNQRTPTGVDSTFVREGDHFLFWYRDY